MTPPSKIVFGFSKSPTASGRAAFLSNEGMSMIFLLIILAVSGIAMMGIMSMGNIQRRSQSQSMVPAQIVMIRGNIMNVLKNQAAWNYTANDSTNSTLNCYNLGHDCVGPSNTPVTGMTITNIYNAAGSIAYYADNIAGTSTRGYGTDGSACNSYPSEECPIKFVVTWECTPSPAGTPTGCNSSSSYSNIKLSLQPLYKPLRVSTGQISPDAIVLNTASYLAGPSLRTATNETFFNFP